MILSFPFFFFFFFFLPFSLILSLSGMEKREIPEAAKLVTIMGEYVGRPSNPKLLKEAVEAHGKMIGIFYVFIGDKKISAFYLTFIPIELIRRWRKRQQHHSPSSTHGLFRCSANNTKSTLHFKI